MGKTVQRLASGGIRIVSANTRTQDVRRRVAQLSARVSAGRRPHKGLLGNIFKTLGRFGAGLVPGGRTVLDAVDAFSGPKDFSPVGCPSGFELSASGVCQEVGFRGAAERFFPGGQTGTLQDVRGDAVIGGFGLPALVPSQVGSITTRSGEVRPILRCNRGMVLGTDNLCYPKAILTPRSRFRKHRRPIAPPISRRDTKAIRIAAAAKERVKELAQDVGFKVSAKGSGTRKKKAKC